MNANGQFKDPATKDEAQEAENPVAGVASVTDKTNKDDKVSATAATNGRKDSSARETETMALSQTIQTERVSQKQTEKSGIAGLMQFVSEALIELRKITWPDRQQVIKETLSVIVLVTIITACVLVFDFGIAKVIFEPLDKLARHLGGGIGVHH